MTPLRQRLPRIDFSDAVPFKIDGEPCKLIQLTRGQFAIVDADLYPWLSRYKWSARPAFHGGVYYAVRNGSHVEKEQSMIRMHRQIMQADDGEEVDHRFHNTLDNRKSQMRRCLKVFNTQNVQKHKDNETGFKGVWLHVKLNKYYASIMVNGTKHRRGPFALASDAAKAYDLMAIQLHGEYAKTNFPKEDYQ